VTGALRGDPQAVAAGEADNLGDVLRAGGQRDRGGMLVHGQVPGLAGVVPASVAGSADRGRGSHKADIGSSLGRSGQVCLRVLDATDLRPGANPLRARISAAPGAPAAARYP